jgi:hypothetical protein
MPKAGSTAFQAWCRSSSVLLAKYGIYYPGANPENGAFIARYLKSPTPISLAKTLLQLKTFVAEGQSRGFQTLLLSSEQIFEHAPYLPDLNANILANLEFLERLSVLVVCRDFQEVAQSSWRQAVLASGERRDFNDYSRWLRQSFSVSQKALVQSNETTLIEYPYTSQLDFSDIIKTVSDPKQQELSESGGLREGMPSAEKSGHLSLNQTLPEFCYRFWLSCNRAYAYKAHCISIIRRDLLQNRPVLRSYFLRSDDSMRCLKVLLLIERSAISSFLLQSPIERAAGLIKRFMNDETQEQHQAAFEFLLVNDDYLYEPAFSQHHAELIVSQMAGNTDRTLRLMDVLEALHRKRNDIEGSLS